MSATNPTGAGRPAVNPNETKGQKLSRLANGRVTKTLDSLDKLGNVGVVLMEYCKETGADPKPILEQILGTVNEKFREVVVRLQTGERSKSVFQLNI